MDHPGLELVKGNWGGLGTLVPAALCTVCDCWCAQALVCRGRGRTYGWKPKIYWQCNLGCKSLIVISPDTIITKKKKRNNNVVQIVMHACSCLEGCDVHTDFFPTSGCSWDHFYLLVHLWPFPVGLHITLQLVYVGCCLFAFWYASKQLCPALGVCSFDWP